jgi:hypothetical protein
MRKFRQWNAENAASTQSVHEGLKWINPDAESYQRHRIHVNAQSRAPAAVLAERDFASAAELTPNMTVLGDPLPGRSALDAKQRASQF